MPRIGSGHLAHHAFHGLNRGNGGATVFHVPGCMGMCSEGKQRQIKKCGLV